jgi:hypothetical protein
VTSEKAGIERRRDRRHPYRVRLVLTKGRLEVVTLTDQRRDQFFDFIASEIPIEEVFYVPE